VQGRSGERERGRRGEGRREGGKEERREGGKEGRREGGKREEGMGERRGRKEGKERKGRKEERPKTPKKNSVPFEKFFMRQPERKSLPPNIYRLKNSGIGQLLEDHRGIEEEAGGFPLVVGFYTADVVGLGGVDFFHEFLEIAPKFFAFSELG
jgi:hypothetical protein